MEDQLPIVRPLAEQTPIHFHPTNGVLWTPLKLTGDWHVVSFKEIDRDVRPVRDSVDDYKFKGIRTSRHCTNPLCNRGTVPDGGIQPNGQLSYEVCTTCNGNCFI